MNISITFRQMDSSDAVKKYCENKVSKLQKFLRQPMRTKVTLSVEKRKHVAEIQISAGGDHIEAREETEDMYVSIDRAIDKLERQVRGNKGAAQAKKRRSGETLRAGEEALSSPENPLIGVDLGSDSQASEGPFFDEKSELESSSVS